MKTNFIYAIMCLITLLGCSCTGNYNKTDYGYVTVVDSTQIEVQFISPEIVRIIKSKADFKFEKQSLAVVKTAENTPLTYSEENGKVVAATSKLKVVLDLKSGALSYEKLSGQALIKEQIAEFVGIKDLGENTFTVKQTFSLDADEYVYGLGQLQNGKMSQRNQTVRLIQDNKASVVPFILSNKGYGLYWDNYSPTTFADSTQATSFYSEVGDCIDYYIMTGDNADGVIAQMRNLTGQAPMMPYWTYGFWQSKERYKSQDETVGVVRKYRELGVPLDGIIQDWQYWGDNSHWNAMAFLNPKFPQPKRMIDEVHDLNAHIIISCWASFGPKTEPYEILKQKGMLMDFTTWPTTPKKTNSVKVYDPYHPEAHNIYWDYLNKGIFSLGMDGWWLDSSEPDHLEIKDEDYNNKTYLGSFRKVRNAFPLMHVGGVASHQKAFSKDKRVFILTRSAFAGQQRYGANSWSGDVVTDWSVLRKQISAGLNFSLTGIPYWNSDIGGFFYMELSWWCSQCGL